MVSFEKGDRVIYSEEGFSSGATVLEVYEDECLIQLDVDYVKWVVNYDDIVREP